MKFLLSFLLLCLTALATSASPSSLQFMRDLASLSPAQGEAVQFLRDLAAPVPLSADTPIACDKCERIVEKIFEVNGNATALKIFKVAADAACLLIPADNEEGVNPFADLGLPRTICKLLVDEAVKEIPKIAHFLIEKKVVQPAEACKIFGKCKAGLNEPSQMLLAADAKVSSVELSFLSLFEPKQPVVEYFSPRSDYKMNVQEAKIVSSDKGAFASSAVLSDLFPGEVYFYRAGDLSTGFFTGFEQLVAPGAVPDSLHSTLKFLNLFQFNVSEDITCYKCEAIVTDIFKLAESSTLMSAFQTAGQLYCNRLAVTPFSLALEDAPEVSMSKTECNLLLKAAVDGIPKAAKYFEDHGLVTPVKVCTHFKCKN